MMGHVVTEEQSKVLNTALSDLAIQSEAETVILSDLGGNVIAYMSVNETESLQTIVALAAGSFAATRELAGFIQEPAFSSIVHEGTISSIYMHNVSSNFLVLVIFGKATTTGLVRLYVEKSCRELEPLLTKIAGQDMSTAAEAADSFEIDASGHLFGAPKES